MIKGQIKIFEYRPESVRQFDKKGVQTISNMDEKRLGKNTKYGPEMVLKGLNNLK